MNRLMERTNQAIVTAPKGMTELVRGCDLRLVGYVEPLVRAGNVILNCAAIERIDAAGIAALISLYGCAQKTGHTFHVSNLRAHVEEVLALVGLDEILVAYDADWSDPVRCTLTAA
jgi:anti-anti-sigma factor